LASFKGKRYVYGIGSETRDILHYLHNNNSVIIASTCRHNSDWKKYEDERCEEDNAQYDRFKLFLLLKMGQGCRELRKKSRAGFRIGLQNFFRIWVRISGWKMVKISSNPGHP